MLKLLVLLIGTANAQNYLPYADIPTARARSQQQCLAVCDPGDLVTKYWWPTQPLTDGTAALIIQSSGDYGPTKAVPRCAVGCGLTAQEQSQLQTDTQMGTKLPWIITEPAFMARFTPIQISAANNSSNPAISVPWNQVKGAATTNLQSTLVTNMVSAMVTDGIITATNALTILAPVPVVVLPP